MKSFETLLSESCSKMSAAQFKVFQDRKRAWGEGATMEGLVNLAESVLAESGHKIRRNNGASSFVTESEYSEEKSTAFLVESMRKSRPQAFENFKETTTGDRLTASQEADVKFCLDLGMSREDAVKVVTEGAGIR